VGYGGPPETESLLVSGCSIETANLPTFLKFGHTKNWIYVFYLQKIWAATKLRGYLEQNWGRAMPSHGPGLKPPLDICA